MTSAFNPDKAALVEAACRALDPPARTLADLGGVWNVDGAYTFHALEHCGVTSAVIADTDVTDTTRARAERNGNVRIVEGLFGAPGTRDAVGDVDVVLLFDVLLHQVAPDWRELLAAYAPRTRAFAVYNPQWTGDGDTFRLVDLGRDRYFEVVPHSASEDGYDVFFDRLDDPYPGHDRPVRDVHYVWQWAITDADLVATMRELGFVAVVDASYGPFAGDEPFERRGFLFVRDSERT